MFLPIGNGFEGQISLRAGVDEDEETQNVLMLAVGVASLLAFLQANLTG